MNALTLVTLLSSSALLIDAESILTSQVFIIPIRPDTFDWNVNGKRTTLLYIDTYVGVYNVHLNWNVSAHSYQTILPNLITTIN